MNDGFKHITDDAAVRIIKQRTGSTLSADEIFWAEFNDSTQILQFEDRAECVWRIDVNGRSCRRWAWGEEWTEWEEKQ